MFLYVHQLVTNLVCLPFGAGQEAYRGFSESPAPENDAIKVVGVKQNIYHIYLNVYMYNMCIIRSVKHLKASDLGPITKICVVKRRK